MTPQSEDVQFLLAASQALQYLCHEASQAAHFVQLGGVQLLLDIVNELSDNIVVLRAVAYLLSVITTHTTLTPRIVDTGTFDIYCIKCVVLNCVWYVDAFIVLNCVLYIDTCVVLNCVPYIDTCVVVNHSC